MPKFWRSNTFRLLVLFCISVLIRVIPMQKWVYGMDEAMHLIAPSFISGSKDLGTKPGYSFVLTIIFVILDNRHPFFIRLLTVTFTSLLPFVGYSFGNKLGGEKIGWVTAIWLTFNHRIFDLSYWIMTDVPFTFLTFLSIFLIFRNFESFENSESNLRLSFTAGILCGLSYLFRQLGIYLIFLVIPFYFLTKGIGLIRKFENFTRFFFGVAIMLVPWFLWSYIQFGVLEPAVSVVNNSSNSIFYADMNYSWLLLGLLTSAIVFLIIYYKNTLTEIKKTFRVFLVCAASVFYSAALFYFVYFSTRGVFKLLLYYIVQIPGLLLGFHLINQYEVTFYAIIISIIIFPIVLVGLVNGYQMNKLVTRITILSIMLLLVLLVNIIYYKVRYFYPIIPVLTPFFGIGLFKIKDFTIYGLKKVHSKSKFLQRAHWLTFQGKSLLLMEIFFVTAILLPNITADILANEYYLSTDEMVVTSPLWEEYINAALWFGTNSDQEAKVMAYKNFEFEYYSHRECIAPPQHIYREHFRSDKQVYITEMMNYMYTHNITHIVYGPFGYSDGILFWLSDPTTPPSYVEVIYLNQSPKVIIYSIQWLDM